MNITKITSCFLLLIAYSCISITTKDAELSLKQQNYIGDKLKIDGYYYHTYGEPSNIEICFLYSNGIFLYGTSVMENEIMELEEKIIDGTYYNYAKGSKSSWGIFNIKNDSIIIERWGYSSGGPLPIYMLKGNIQNDTTFIIHFDKNKTQKIEEDFNIIYRYKKFTPKPDSLNSYIPTR